MIFCSPKLPPSTYPERLPEYLRKQQSSSAAVFLEHLPKDADDALIDEVTAVLTRSFRGDHTATGEAMFDWAIGTDFPRTDPSMDAKRFEWMNFYMKFNLILALEYGLVVIARDGSATGKVLGAALSFPPGTAYRATGFGLHWIRIGFRIGHGPSDVLGNEPNQRMGKLGDVMKNTHNPAEAHSTASNPNGTPPWYILVLGVDTTAQGKKCGSALLDCIHYLADSDGADTMLEYSGDRKEGYYCGKHGYKNFGDKVPCGEKGDALYIENTAAIRGYRQPRLPQ